MKKNILKSAFLLAIIGGFAAGCAVEPVPTQPEETPTATYLELCASLPDATTKTSLGTDDGNGNFKAQEEYDTGKHSPHYEDAYIAKGTGEEMFRNKFNHHGFQYIRLMCLVASPQGVKAVRDCHPDVDIYLASLDEGLNDKNYILPGLGDAGDRIFGTK